MSKRGRAGWPARWIALSVVALLALAPVADAKTRYPLTYSKAKHAAQVRADKEAKQHAEINAMQRTGTRSFYTQAKWSYEDPSGCKGCGYNSDTGTFFDTPTTVSCSAEITVKRSAKNGKIKATLDGKSCF